MQYGIKKLILLLLLISATAPFALAQGGEAELAGKYFEEGEYENALQLYQKLQRKEPSDELFNLRIVACQQKLERYDDAIDFLDKVMRRFPEDHIYAFVQADLYKLTGDFKKSESLETETIEKKIYQESEFMEIGAWLYKGSKYKLALRTYLQARKTLKDKRLFSSEIAELYYLDGQFGAATEEFLRQYENTPILLTSVNSQILRMVDDRSKDAIEQTLLTAVNRNSSDAGFRSILYEFYVLTENFYEAFVQCKSMDKVFGERGRRVFEFALTMRNNKNYKLSNKALDYIIESDEQSPYYLKAYQEKTVNGELEAFTSVPVDTTVIREAVVAYDKLLSRFGRKAQFFDAMYRKANLLAFYLFDLESALAELENALERPLQPSERAQARLLMGDILLMQKEYSKATLIYDEVAESFHEGQIGAMAKFKQGRLSYFKGDFEYSQARLKTIKDNTSNDISNDAIKMYLLIQDNIGLDTTTFPLQRFAQAQLMVFQRDFEPAMALLDSIQYAFPNHTLTDEIYWEKANILLSQNKLDQGLVLLDKIITNFAEDIYGDDALYTKARIYDYTLADKEQAMTLYIQFLTQYSGSLYIVEVRKRIRELRNERL